MKLNVFGSLAGLLIIMSVFMPWFSVQTSTNLHSEALVPLVFNLGVLYSHTRGYLDLTSPPAWIYVILVIMVISGVICFFNGFIGGVFGTLGIAFFLVMSPYIYLIWKTDLTYVGLFVFSISLSYGFFLALGGCLLAFAAHTHLKSFSLNLSFR